MLKKITRSKPEKNVPYGYQTWRRFVLTRLHGKAEKWGCLVSKKQLIEMDSMQVHDLPAGLVDGLLKEKIIGECKAVSFLSDNDTVVSPRYGIN